MNKVLIMYEYVSQPCYWEHLLTICTVFYIMHEVNNMFLLFLIQLKYINSVCLLPVVLFYV